MKTQKKQKAEILFEVSWEVCNKVGGIYTVISSKAGRMIEYYGDNYFLVGPYISESCRSSFKEEPIPDRYKELYGQLKNLGIVLHFGSWLIEGEPKVILIDYRNFWSKINDIKKELWDNFNLDSLNSPYDFNEPVLWSWAAGMLIEKISSVENKKIVVQAHEWLSGATILYLKKNKVKVATVFTTHATTLGRTIAGHGEGLYSNISKINPKDESYKYGINAKHEMEKITAHIADIFTTVSQITSLEAKYLLEKEADLLLPNGLDMSKFPSFEELTLKHNTYRTKLREFVLFYFFPYYNIDLKNTLFFFTASRYEFHNKGLDIFIESLGKLNEAMKKEKSKKTIVTFFWIPASIDGIRQDLIGARESFQDLKDLLEEKESEIKENLLYTISSEKEINIKNIVGESSSLELRKKILQLKSKPGGQAPLSTHEILDPENDPIIKAFKQAKLFNREEDKVKVIFYPIYLSGADGLSDLDYYQSIQACHLGVFPSYYEPWGYTPLETAALGVASLTSNLSGFGRYFYDKLKGSELPGVYILDIENTKREDMMKTFADVLYSYQDLDKKSRIDNKIQARKVAFMADWKIFAENYIDAHNKAIEKAGL